MCTETTRFTLGPHVLDILLCHNLNMVWYEKRQISVWDTGCYEICHTNVCNVWI